MSDSFNRHLCDEASDVNPAVRQISLLHVADEARHIEYARARLAAILADCGALQRGAWSVAARILLQQMTAVFYTPPAPFYRLAGLPPRIDWRAAALRNPARRQFVAQRVAPTLELLRGIGLNVGA